MANLNYRKKLVRKIKAGLVELKVMGGKVKGFNLFAETKKRLIPVFAPTFTSEEDAIQYGARKTGTQATRRILSSAVAKRKLSLAS